MNSPAQKPHRVVIVGMGFAGINVYKRLLKDAKKREVEITAIAPTDHFTLTPLIHEVASGLLRPDSVTESLRNSVGLTAHEFIEGSATAVDLANKTVAVKTTEGIAQDIAFDTLVVAIGSTTNYMRVPGAEEHGLALKTLEDAKIIKNRILEEFDDAADRVRAGEEASVRIAIVGGGATGVEVAGELIDFLELLSTTYPDVQVPHTITLLDGADTLVKAAAPWMGQAAYKLLTNRPNISVKLSMRVKAVTPHGVETETDMIPADVVIWTAGVQAEVIEWKPTEAVKMDEKSRRVHINEYFALPDHPDVYVLDDQAIAENPKNPYPMRAQIARKEGKATGRNILRKLRGQPQQPYAWHDWGIILTFGEGGGIAELKGVRLRGFLAWAIYRITYLHSLVGTRAKLRTGLEWLINLFKMRDVGKV